MNKLDKGEKELLDSFERNEWKSVKNISNRKEELKEFAQATIEDARLKKYIIHLVVL